MLKKLKNRSRGLQALVVVRGNKRPILGSLNSHNSLIPPWYGNLSPDFKSALKKTFNLMYETSWLSYPTCEFPWCCPDHRNYTDQPLLSTIGQYPTIRPNPVDQDTGHIQLSGYCSQYENIRPSLAHLCMCISTRTILKHVCLLVCVLDQSITQLSEGRFVMGHGYLPTRWRPDHPPGGAPGGQRVIFQERWFCASKASNVC